MFWGNWSADLRYQHYDFGSKNLTFTDSFTGLGTVANTKQWIDAVTLGLNYHFPTGSWQPAAASAKEEDAQKETLAVNGGLTYTQPYSLYGDFAMLWGPEGLDNSGFRFRLATVDGAYSFLENGNFGQRQPFANDGCQLCDFFIPKSAECCLGREQPSAWDIVGLEVVNRTLFDSDRQNDG